MDKQLGWIPGLTLFILTLAYILLPLREIANYGAYSAWLMNPKILFLEHDEDDVYITKTFFKEMGLNVDLQIVSSPELVESVLMSLIQEGEKLPDIFLMDYNAIPESAGQFIARLKSNDLFNSIPVIVLRGTSDPETVKECYASGAASFIEKPGDSDEIKGKITMLLNYWFSCVSLP